MTDFDSAYSPIELTPQLSAEIESLCMQGNGNENLKRALSTFFAAANKPAMTVPRATIAEDVAVMDASRLRAELLVMIDAYREVVLACGSLLTAAARQRIVARSETGVKAAKARHENHPKRAAKEAALELWKERHAGKHPKLRTVKQFATEVMYRWPVLKSASVISGWSAKWTKDVKQGRTPVC